jgi:NADH pyrophosphatase NudC (nudix superfamily)
LLHEFGHIVGLINEAGFQSKYAHEDLDHPYHSTNENSVMYYQATYEDYQDFDNLDQNDLKDIAALPYTEPNSLLINALLILVVLGIIVVGVGAVLRVKESRELAADRASEMPVVAGTSALGSGEESQYFCPTCGNRATYVAEYERWYCYNCSKYLKLPALQD